MSQSRGGHVIGEARRLPDEAAYLRRMLVDPPEVCRRLGLDEGARPQIGGLIIRCPWHDDRSPSCSVRIAPDGTIAAHCFSCGEGGDVLDLVAVVHDLNTRTDFGDVLKHAAELAGTAHELRPLPSPPDRRKRTPFHEPEWPPIKEVERFWSRCLAVSDAAEVAAWLRSRALDPGAVDDHVLARALPSDLQLPRWARFHRKPWPASGYLCVLPMFDNLGSLRSVRVRRTVGCEGPKALPPTGYRTGGLVMADALGRALLVTGIRPEIWPEGSPLRVIIAEGEPDFLTWGTAFSDADATAPAVFGIVAGSWTSAIAARVPDGSRIIIRTDHDEPGEKYARQIRETLLDRCTVLRGGAGDCVLCPDFGWTRAV